MTKSRETEGLCGKLIRDVILSLSGAIFKIARVVVEPVGIVSRAKMKDRYGMDLRGLGSR